MRNINHQASRVVSKFEGIYARRFTSLCQGLSVASQKTPTDLATVDQLLKDEQAWLNGQTGNDIDRLRYRAILLILRDLLSVSWQVHYANDGIDIVAPPIGRRKGLSPTERNLMKDVVRHELSSARQEQLADKSTQEFIRAVEDPSTLSKNRLSIKHLLANGPELANRLRAIADHPVAKQVDGLSKVVQPYLVLVEPEERDPFTGIKYGDIWRYFRLTWAIPNVPAPGRKLFYLVRDAAQPYHPIMAIAGLSNAALVLKDRDDYIGWTAESFIYRLLQAVDLQDIRVLEGLLALLEHHIASGLEDINTEGIVEPHEVEAPNEALLRRLQAATTAFSRERQRQLQISNVSGASTDLGLENDVPTDGRLNGKHPDAASDIVREASKLEDEILEWDEQASTKALEARRHLILKKRTQNLYQLLFARRELQRVRHSPLPLREALKTALHREEFKTALTYATFSNKREKVGINMLEITTCGAIPPYNHLLGGKLMALLLLSPQVIADYRARYGSRYSWIASQVKGEKIYRGCDLVFLSTTSLYSVGSSQYNRVILPAQTYHPDQPRIEYKNKATEEDIRQGYPRETVDAEWQTSGYGTVHFSTETTEAVVALGIHENGFREVNNIFGEGPSPKLRKIRNGLQAVGLDPDVLLRHNQPRLLYCVELCKNSRRYLNGEPVELPEYITHPERVPHATEKITQFWRDRWLVRRLHTPGILEKIVAFTPDEFTLQLEPANDEAEGLALTMNGNSSPPDLSDTAARVKPSATASSVGSPPPLSADFLRKLYLSRSSYSDFLTADTLRALHIETPLDDFIIKHVRAGNSIVITGNAGDGKTHLIKQLQSELAGARVVEDASLLEPGEIVEQWQAAIIEGVPFCIAANEWPLFQLISRHATDLPILSDVAQQIKTSLIYDNVASQQEDLHGLIVVNLGLRNPLQRNFFDAAITTLLERKNFTQCLNCAGTDTCDAVRNRDLLMEHTRIRHALLTLIERLSIFGHHVTVRQLFGFMSYAVFGGRDSSSLAREHGKNQGFYSQLIFDRKAHGTIFDLLRNHLDPATISHPKWDTRLYFGDTVGSDWELGEAPLPGAAVEKPADFEFIKRRFFFEHAHGLEMLNMLANDEKEFEQLLEPQNDDLEAARDRLISSINAYFCPQFADPMRNQSNDLIVWSTHTYDERVPRAFTSWFSIDRRRIRLQRPKLTPRLQGAFTYRPDHLRLVVLFGENQVTLTLDYDLYHTLMEVQRGLPAVLVDEGKSVRLFRFMSQLEAKRSHEDVPRIYSYTAQGGDILQIDPDVSRRRITLLA